MVEETGPGSCESKIGFAPTFPTSWNRPVLFSSLTSFIPDVLPESDL